jgi:hypothetical protein
MQTICPSPSVVPYPDLLAVHPYHDSPSLVSDSSTSVSSHHVHRGRVLHVLYPFPCPCHRVCENVPRPAYSCVGGDLPSRPNLHSRPYVFFLSLTRGLGHDCDSCLDHDHHAFHPYVPPSLFPSLPSSIPFLPSLTLSSLFSAYNQHRPCP